MTVGNYTILISVSTTVITLCVTLVKKKNRINQIIDEQLYFSSSY